MCITVGRAPMDLYYETCDIKVTTNINKTKQVLWGTPLYVLEITIGCTPIGCTKGVTITPVMSLQ